MSLAAFLAARIAEDEAAARAVSTGLPATWAYDGEWNVYAYRADGYSGDGRCTEHPAGVPNDCDDTSLLEVDDLSAGGRGTPEAIAAHVIRWDPARALAECAAKRAVIDEHRPVSYTNVPLGFRDVTVCWSCHGAYVPDDFDFAEEPVKVQQPYPCRTLRAFAAVYAGHPDYRREWTP